MPTPLPSHPPSSSSSEGYPGDDDFSTSGIDSAIRRLAVMKFAVPPAATAAVLGLTPAGTVDDMAPAVRGHEEKYGRESKREENPREESGKGVERKGEAHGTTTVANHLLVFLSPPPPLSLLRILRHSQTRISPSLLVTRMQDACRLSPLSLVIYIYVYIHTYIYKYTCFRRHHTER